MEATNYTSIGPVLQLNKAGELTQKRMKAVKVCDGLYISEPDKTQFIKMIIEFNGVMWIEHTMPAKHTNPELLAKRMPAVLKTIEGGKLATMNEYRQEINRRIFSPDSPAIMELKQPERKKPAPLAENERKVSVLMFKGCTDGMTEKKVVITEVAPHIYTYAYKMKRYGERVKIILEVDGVYFEACDKGAYITEREDFTEVCTKAYEHARDNVAAGAASGMAYFIEVQKRIDAATPTETPRISTETAEVTELSAEATKAEEAPKYSISERDGNVYVTFKRGVIRQCAKRCGVSCKSAEWNTIAQAYNGTHSDMGWGLSFFFDGREDAVRFAELVCNGDISGYYKLYMDKIIAEGEARKKRIAEECAEYDAAQAYFAECMADEDAETVNVSTEGGNAENEAENEPIKERMKSYARITGQHNRLWLAANGNKARQDRITAIWHRYTANISKHFKNPFISEWDAHGTDELPRSIYAATDAPQPPETPQTVECTTDTPKPRENAA